MSTAFSREKRKNFIDNHSSTHSLDAKTVENIRSYFGLDDSTAVRNYLESLGVKEG